MPTNFFSVSKTYLGWLRNQFLGFGDAFARARAGLEEVACGATSGATWLPDEISAPKWPENRFFQKSSELESFQTLWFWIPLGSNKSSSVVTSTKKIDWCHFRMDFWEERSGGNAVPAAFFGPQSSRNPLANFLSKCVKNSQFFIFRISNSRALSYFKMRKNSGLELILSSETWF